MARTRARGTLHLFLNGRLVGHLRRRPTGAVDLRYDPAWLSWEHALPVSLSLPLQEQPHSGDAVLAFLDNLLPDASEIRRRIAERTGAEGTDPYRLLATIGRDCVGAIQLLPEGVDPGPAGEVHGHGISDAEIAERLRNLPRAPLGLGQDEELRFSIAGAQDKTALLRYRGRWRIPVGATPTTHILKPAIGRLRSVDLSDSVENEHFCMTFVGALGLPVARTEIRDFDGVRALIVERFDRHWTREKQKRLLRLPQEDLCQALGVPSSRKYQAEGGPGMAAALGLLEASDDPARDRELFFRAQLVYWLLGATDGHAKNFSIHLYPGGRFRLTPLYDIVSAQPYADTGRVRRGQTKLAMSFGGKYRVHDVAHRHIERAAHDAGLPEAALHAAVDHVLSEGPRALDRAAAAMPPDIPSQLIDSIQRGVRSRLDKLQRTRSP